METHREAHGAEATQRRTAADLDHHHQVAEYQRVVRDECDGLTPEEREVWTTDAAARSPENAAADGTIFECVLFSWSESLLMLILHQESDEACPQYVRCSSRYASRWEGRHWCGRIPRLVRIPW
jgi:hypothetical protein